MFWGTNEKGGADIHLSEDEREQLAKRKPLRRFIVSASGLHVLTVKLTKCKLHNVKKQQGGVKC